MALPNVATSAGGVMLEQQGPGVRPALITVSVPLLDLGTKCGIILCYCQILIWTASTWVYNIYTQPEPYNT